MRRTLIALGAIAVFFAAGIASAQSDSSTTDASAAPTSVMFPIAELGNCGSKAECKAYCDISSHQQACLSYAETHGLMKKEDTDKARAILMTTGPGGCKGAAACKAYCADQSHQDECMSFAESHGLVNAAQASVVQDIKQNGGPGGCTTPDACRSYCSDTTHIDECKAFAQAHGLKPESGQLMKNPNAATNMGSSTEAKTVQINAILAKTAGPGGCTTADTCRTYCADVSHKDECAAFAKANGLMGNAGNEGVRMGSSTKPMMPMHMGSTSMQMRPMMGSTTSGHPMLKPGARPRPSAEGMQRGTTTTNMTGDMPPPQTGEVPPPQPEDNASAGPDASSGGAGVLWGVLHFFGVK